MNKKILFLVAHPHLLKSRANRAVTEAVAAVEGITTHRLYDLYPYFHIDVEREQQILLQHDLIVVQHPFYWYSTPPLLKMWLDEVLESGWAYGPGGTALAGKDFLLSITAGGDFEAYTPAGSNRFTMETLLSPWQQTVQLCQMRWHRPRVLHASIRANDTDLHAHAERLCVDLVRYCAKGMLS